MLGMKKAKTLLFFWVGGNFRTLLTAGVGLVLCLIIPLTTAYAQAPDLTGTVSCVETTVQYDDSIVSSKNVYDVEVLFPNLIADRWGPGKDVVVGGLPSFKRPGQTIELDDLDSFPKGLTEIFWTIPDSRYGTCGTDKFCLEAEEVYSEAGRWELKLHGDQVQYKGTSFAVMEFWWDGDSEPTIMSAECDWNLSGSL